VLDPNFHWEHEKVRWERILFIIALIAVPAVLISCGSNSNSTTTTPTITVSCNPVDVTVLSTSQCTATVLNLSSTLVNWSVGGTGTGSISTGGLYTAPATVPTSNVVTITATSQAQSSLTATASLTIVAATAITAVTCVDPGTNVAASSVSSGNQLACTATASTGATVPVNWTVTNTNKLGGNIGSISAQGIYTAPLVPPPGAGVTITATSQAVSTQTMSVTATVIFGNKVLSGPYVFSTSGRLTPAKLFWARVGSFTAGGGALSGIEDTNQGGTSNIVTTQRTFTGSYSIGPDGRGTLQFCEGTSSSCPLGSSSVTAFFRIVVISPSQAHIIEFSSQATTSATTTAGGEILSQDPSVPGAGNGNLSGTYSFNFAGVSATGTEESVIGDFASNGFGSISLGGPSAPGEMDINAGGPLTLVSTSYSISANGRGTVTLSNGTGIGSVSLIFSFYPVSASRVKFIEIDPVPPVTTASSILVGDAFKQQTSSTCGWGLSALSGSTVLETTGNASGIVVQDLANFTASNGSASVVSMDQNSGGVYTQPTGTGTDNYTMDACGRGTLSVAGHSYVFYIISPSDAVLQEVTSGTVAYGFIMPSQGGPFMDSTLTGSYGFKMGGTDAAGTAGNREDFIGQFTSSGKGTGLAGTLDLNDFGVTQAGVGITNGTYLPSGSLRATIALPLATTPSATTRNLVLYMVSPTFFYVLDMDQSPAGTAIGVINNQF